MGTPMPTAGTDRERLILMIHKPLVAWIRTVGVGIFTNPHSSEACDMTAEAVTRALRDTVGREAGGKAVLKRIALDILDDN
jgi:hypothetical protein